MINSRRDDQIARDHTEKDLRGQHRGPLAERITARPGLFALAILIAVGGHLEEPGSGVPEGIEEITVGVPNHVEGKILGDNWGAGRGKRSFIWSNALDWGRVQLLRRAG